MRRAGGAAGTGSAIPAAGATPIVIEGRIDAAHAPVPRNDAERLAFRQMYETLVRLDCTGAVRPGLARRWQGDSSGRMWSFELDGRFADGTPVTAGAVLASWDRARAAGLAHPFAATSPAESVVVVQLAEPAVDGPAVLADPGLAVAGSGGSWPAASGAFRPDTARGHLETMPRPGVNARGMEFLRGRSGDSRDFIDAGADLLVTRDPAMIAYAGARPGFRTVPLPWDRLYALVVPNADSVTALSAELRTGLARDAVRAEARAAEAPYPALAADGCRGAARGASPGAPRPRIVYPSGDPTARELAARLVALGPRLSAVALDPGAFAAALAAGDDAAYVVSLPRTARAICAEIPAWPAGAAALPMIDGRATLIIRDGAPPLAIEADGAVRILPDSAP